MSYLPIQKTSEHPLYLKPKIKAILERDPLFVASLTTKNKLQPRRRGGVIEVSYFDNF